MPQPPKQPKRTAASDLVLVVDNDPELRHVLERALRSRGWQTHAEPDGLRALQYLERVCPAVVIVDERMPGLAGAGLLEHVRRVCASARLILLSGFPSDQARERVEALGGTVLVKGDTELVLEAVGVPS